MTESTKINPPTPAATPAAPTGLDQIKQLLKEVSDLKAKVDAKTGSQPQPAAVQSKPKEIDWTKITEVDIANLDIPIPVFEQQIPEYLTVHLKDKNYVARWVHTLPERLGVCLATGYSYISKEDLDLQYSHSLNFDESGHYKHGDVVCLKILKERYYGAIKRNYLKTMAIHGKAQVRSRTMNEIEREDPRIADAIHRGAMTLYEPEDMKGMEVPSSLFSSSSNT